MRIRGLGVIDDAVLPLGPGLTVITGETGAGKTMVVHGLALLVGGRAAAALVRPGAARAVVEGRLVVDPSSAAATRVVDAGGELDDGVVLVARTLAGDGGRSRVHVGGRAVPTAVLTEVCESLVALHGQHDQQRLYRADERRAILDRYAGPRLRNLATSFGASFDEWVTTGKRIAEISARRRERAQEADLLRIGLAEIAAVSPVPGEESALELDVARLAHADALRAAAEGAHGALVGDPAAPVADDALALVARARHSLAAATGLDPALDGMAQRLAEVGYLLADVAADLASYAGSVDADPQRLEAAQQRQASLSTLTRKYGDDAAAVLSWAASATLRLAELDQDDDTLDRLRDAHRSAEEAVAALAADLSAARRAAARRLGDEVTSELAALAMPQARLEVTVTDREVAEDGVVIDGRRVACTRAGVDEVDLLLQAHPGAPALPVSRSASGGELSRVMLALEVALADTDPVPTMVFDEVDAGVGGRAAVEVGRRLARLARSHQVIVVTHLPQVAAFADHHLLVVKDASGSVTSSDVTPLDDTGRLRELSRMLAGLDDSSHARGHAEELIALAAADRAGAG